MMRPRWSLLAAGLAALRSWRILLLLFLSVTLAALPATLAFTAEASGAFGKGPAGAAMLENSDPAVGFYLIDFMHHQKPFGAWALLLVFGILLMFVQQAFLAGGIVEFAGREPRPFFGAFFRACGQHLKHNLKLTALFLFALLFILGTYGGVASRIATAPFKDAPPNTPLQLVVSYAVFAVGLFIYAAMRAIVDLARASVRYRPFRGTIAALRDGATWFIRAPFRIVGALLFWLVIGAIVQLILIRSEWSLTPTTGAEVLLVFLFAQLAIVWRSAMRLAGFGSVVRYAEILANREDEQARVERERLAAEEAARLRADRERAYRQWLESSATPNEPYEIM